MTETKENQGARKPGETPTIEKPTTPPVPIEQAAVPPEGFARIVIDFNPETHDFGMRWNLGDICMIYGMLELAREQFIKNRAVAKAQASIIGAMARAEQNNKIKVPTAADVDALKSSVKLQ